MIKLYNTLTRQKEELKPINKDWVGLYTCGPTVYNFAHIGNLRTYIFEDLLQRTLSFYGNHVKRVMNITDVGHLTSDADAGDDKLDKAAHAQQKSVQEIAQFYTDAFLEDLKKLNIVIPETIAPASKFIPDQIAIIKTLFEKGFAYDTPTAVYFDVSKFPEYGKLSGQSLAEKMTGARGEVVVDAEKHNAADFAPWFKIVGKFEHHLLHWPSPWGEGFPGWHIECSAISRHFLGQPFDIHTGGVDHIGTHHENEIAQSEAAFGVPLANIWMHGEFLNVASEKMAKSAGTFITLADLEKKGYHPLVYRYFTLGAHYRTQLNFTWEALDAAKQGLQNLYTAYYLFTKEVDTAPFDTDKKFNRNSLEYREIINPYLVDFMDAVQDDLNIPKALSIVYKLLETQTPFIHPGDKLRLLEQWDEILGLNIKSAGYDLGEAEKTRDIVERYRLSRANKQFEQSDALRKEIEALGYSVRDTKDGPYLVKKFF